MGDPSATFTPVVGGSSLTYEWKKGTTVLSDDAKYSGTTSAKLTINNLVAGDTDDYTLTVTGVSASTVAVTARLTVNSGPIGPKTWTGGGGDDKWSTAGNWGGTNLNLGGDPIFFDGTTRLTPVMDGTYDVSAVTFNSGAGAFAISASSGTLLLSGALTNSSANAQTLSLPIAVSATRVLSANSGNVTLSGVVSGLGGINKLGAQTLTLSGASANTFTGGLTVNGGSVVLNKSPDVAAVGGTITVGTGASLSVAASGQIPDTAVVDLQTGNGTLSLASGVSETFKRLSTGPLNGTNVSGNIQLGANAQLTLTPDTGVGPSAVSVTAASPAGTRLTVGASGTGGEIRWTPQNMINSFEKLVIAPGGRLRLGHGGNPWNGQDSMLGAVPASFMQDQICITNGQIGFNGADLANKFLVNANRGETISGNATNETLVNTVFPGKITGPGTMYHNGGGDLELSAANDFSGGLKLSAGAVVAANAPSVGPGTIAFINNLARLAVSADGITIPNQIDLSAVITNSFGYVKDFTLSGDVNLGDTGSSPQLNVTNAANTITFTGQLTNTLGLVKNGAGTVILTGANSYGGSTEIINGTLLVNNTTGSGTSVSAVTVQPAGTLGGSGTIAGDVTVNGAISPGASVGTLTTAAQTWGPGGRYVWQMNDATGTAGVNPGWDKLVSSGFLSILSSPSQRFTVDITSLAGAVAGPAAHFNNTAPQSWTILSAAGGIGGFDPANFTLNTGSFSNPLGSAYFAITNTGNDLMLQLLIAEVPTNLVATVAGSGSFTGTPNLGYTVKYSDSLSPANWQTLVTVTTDGAGVGTFTDPGPLPDARFYRIFFP